MKTILLTSAGMNMKDVIVKKSKISKKGVFAGRNFKKGEVVLEWLPKFIKKHEIDKLPHATKHYIEREGEKYFLMQSPERYVNHSCEPNTMAKGLADVAIKNIMKGEEITSDYGNAGIISFKCKCGSKKCRRII